MKKRADVNPLQIPTSFFPLVFYTNPTLIFHIPSENMASIQKEKEPPWVGKFGEMLAVNFINWSVFYWMDIPIIYYY